MRLQVLASMVACFVFAGSFGSEIAAQEEAIKFSCDGQYQIVLGMLSTDPQTIRHMEIVLNLAKDTIVGLPVAASITGSAGDAISFRGTRRSTSVTRTGGAAEISVRGTFDRATGKMVAVTEGAVGASGAEKYDLVCKLIR